MLDNLVNRMLNKEVVKPKEVFKADRIRAKEQKAAEKEREKIKKEETYIQFNFQLLRSTHKRLKDVSYKSEIEMYTIVNKAILEYLDKEIDNQ